jgi:hypothetical protein
MLISVVSIGIFFGGGLGFFAFTDAGIFWSRIFLWFVTHALIISAAGNISEVVTGSNRVSVRWVNHEISLQQGKSFSCSFV